MRLKRICKNIILGITAFSVFAGSIGFTPEVCLAEEKKMTLATARSLALENSTAYESAESAVYAKEAARDSALKSLKLKEKNMSTFRWSPLLNFKFPEKPNMAQASEFQFKPVQLASDILVAQHKMQDTIFTVNEQVNNLYVDIVTVQETLAFNEQKLEALNKGIAHNKARLKLGEATQADVDRQEKKADNLSNTIAANKRTLEADLKKMTSLTGLDVTTGYTFEKPYVEANISRDSLPALKQYTEDRDQSFYEACATATTAKKQLETNYNLMKGHYGKDINMISNYVNQSLNGEKVSAKAFKQDYKKFLDKIDSYWEGSYRVCLFIKIPKVWTKGSLDGARYIEDDPYTLYQNALDYSTALKDMEAAKKDLDQSVEDSFNNYISVRNAYDQALKDLDKKDQDMRQYAVKNRMGYMTLEEYEDEQADYEELQNALFTTMKQYTSTLYSFDRLTCGGVSTLLSGTDMDLQTAVVGESYVQKDEKEAKYFLQPIIQREIFELSIFIPEDFPVEITDFELWCDNIQVGNRTPKDGKIRHLALSKEKIDEVKIRLYNGDEFVDDCVIDPDEASGTLNVVTAMNIKKDETGDVGTYNTKTSNVTGFVSIDFKPLDADVIKYYRVLSEDGTPLGDGEKKPISKSFTHLGLVSGDLSKLKIELYDDTENLKYTAHMDVENKKLIKTDTDADAGQE
ncbi:MAG: TolC family protein [Lachnospiraceae bacterium]|nr:TolC family protein [Lachnospiraceae bacterium]